MELLAATAAAEDEHRCQETVGIHDQIWKKSGALEARLAQTIRLRNEVGRLEQQVQAMHNRLGEGPFQWFAQFDTTGAEPAAGLQARAGSRPQELFAGSVKMRPADTFGGLRAATRCFKPACFGAACPRLSPAASGSPSARADGFRPGRRSSSDAPRTRRRRSLCPRRRADSA